MKKVEKIDNNVKVNNAIISVFDKTGVEDFVDNLIQINPEINIYSTGGTYKKLMKYFGEDNTNIKEVSTYIGQPETDGGLVKTLDFKLFLGYLTDTYNEKHQEDLKRTDSVPIDLVAFNLYPFQDVVAKEGIDVEDARMNIDVGGPSALRAAGKNWLRVATIVNPLDYNSIIAEMRENEGCTTLETRFNLNKKVFNHLAEYNVAIANYYKGVSVENAMKPYDIQ